MVKQSKMPQKLQKEVSRDCRLLLSALLQFPTFAEGWGGSGVMPEGSCSLLTRSSPDTSNNLVDIQPEVNTASSSSKSHDIFSEILPHLTAASLRRREGYQSLLYRVRYPQESSRRHAVNTQDSSKAELDKTEHSVPV